MRKESGPYPAPFRSPYAVGIYRHQGVLSFSMHVSKFASQLVKHLIETGRRSNSDRANTPDSASCLSNSISLSEHDTAERSAHGDNNVDARKHFSALMVSPIAWYA